MTNAIIAVLLFTLAGVLLHWAVILWREAREDNARRKLEQKRRRGGNGYDY